MFCVGPANSVTPFSKLRLQEHSVSAKSDLTWKHHNYRKVEESRASLLANMFYESKSYIKIRKQTQCSLKGWEYGLRSRMHVATLFLTSDVIRRTLSSALLQTHT